MVADVQNDDSASVGSVDKGMPVGVQVQYQGEADINGDLTRSLAGYVPGTEEEKKLLRKIDAKFMPVLWLMYVLNYLDRTNIGNAKVAGMATDLNLDDTRYAWALSIFFFGYLICEVPSNMILSRSRPSIFLPAIMIVWGALSALMSISNTYGALLGFRFVLGCIESGFFPGVLFLMSCWYKSDELGKRFGIFYTAAVISGALGGLLAGAITGNLNGAHGIAGWRWLFIIEGVCTVGVAGVAHFIILDFPATSKHLTARERELAVVRLLHDGIATGKISSAARLTHWQAFKSAVTDVRTYIFMLLFVLVVGAGTISYFIPTITKSMGYDTVTAQYMTIPVYVVAAVCLNVGAISSDRFNEMRWHITVPLAIGFACSLVTIFVLNPVVRYVMLCFVAAGIWTALPQVLAWTSKTVTVPAEKRAIVLAMVNAVGNLASVYGSRIWPTGSAPNYTLGWGVTAGFLGGGAVLACLIPVLLKYVPVPKTPAEQEVEELG